MVARNRDRRPTRETRPEATMHRLAPLPLGRLDALLQFPAFFNPRWIRQIHRTARQVSAELLLVRDLPLAPTAIAVGKQLGLPVMLDMAENYPAMMSSIFATGVAGPIDWVVRNPLAVRALERWVLRHIDHVLVVVEESAERLVALGMARDRITLVSNTPPVSRIPPTPRVIRGDRPLHLVYLGLLEAPRGLGVVIAAVAMCRQAGLDVRLTIIGKGRERAHFEDQAAALGLTAPSIEFLGFLPNPEALAIVASADVGLVPHMATDSWNTTIPNKLFDYMAVGLPVISSNARPAARIVAETGTGLVYPHDQPGALADAIRQMAEPARRAGFSANGPRAIAETYCWERDVHRLLDAVERTCA